MYRCTDCGKIFEDFKEYKEKHGLKSPPFESIAVCPFCGSTAVQPIKVKHCRCCGARLKDDGREYCSEACHARGMKMWIMEIRRKRRWLQNPINIILNELEQYNKIHSTTYTYGQYVAAVRPRLKKRKDGTICLA